jgi:hypothetical protein
MDAKSLPELLDELQSSVNISALHDYFMGIQEMSADQLVAGWQTVDLLQQDLSRPVEVDDFLKSTKKALLQRMSQVESVPFLGTGRPPRQRFRDVTDGEYT